MPTDLPRPTSRTSDGAVVEVRIPARLIKEMRSLCASRHCSLYTGLMAIYQLLLVRYAGNAADVCVGTPNANRHADQVKDVPGYFVNTIPIRTDLSGDPTFLDMLSRVQQVAMASMRYMGVPFTHMVKALRSADLMESDASKSPVFQHAFILQAALFRPGLKIPMPDSTDIVFHGFGTTLFDTFPAMFDIFLELFENNDDQSSDMIGNLTYNTSIYERHTMDRFLTHYINLLESCLKSPGETIWFMDMLSSQERHTLLYEWSGNDKFSDIPDGKLLHHLIEDQVKRLPASAVALEDYSTRNTVTYQELDDMAEKVRIFLQALGVGNECRVGMMMERSCEGIVAMYGILKAGAGYVPIDNEYPFAQVTSTVPFFFLIDRFFS